MKKLSDIIGLRIVTINDGHEVGIIRSVIINSSKGRIEYFATEKGISLLKAKIADARYVEGIGDYALTMKNKEDVLDINMVPEALELVYQGVEVIGNRVISRKGKLIGEAVDLLIDEEDGCRVSSVQIITNGIEPRIYNILAANVVTYGQNFLVIDEENTGIVKPDNKEMSSGIENIDANILEKIDEVNRIDEMSVLSKKALTMKNVSDLLEFKQKQFLKGKICGKMIFSNEGEVIVEEGQMIDETVYDLLKSKGKIFELVKSLG